MAPGCASHLLFKERERLVSAARILKITNHAAWFSSYRLCEAMRAAKLDTMGGVATSTADYASLQLSVRRVAGRRVWAFRTSPNPDEPDCEFVKACRELGIDEDPAAFDQVLKKISKAPPLLRT
jgi:hypothetical protein